MIQARDWIASVQRCVDSAAPGPWEIEQLTRPAGSARIHPASYAVDRREVEAPVCYSSSPNNWDFIAASRSDLPRALAALSAVLNVCDEFAGEMQAARIGSPWERGILATRVRDAIHGVLLSDSGDAS